MAVTQLDERQAGSLRRPPAANWVGAEAEPCRIPQVWHWEPLAVS